MFSERKAKEAEQQIREIARKAREQHRLNSVAEFETAYSDAAPGVPPGKQAVLEWYRTNEYPKKAGIDSSNNVEPWFHGEFHVIFNLTSIIPTLALSFLNERRSCY